MVLLALFWPQNFRKNYHVTILDKLIYDHKQLKKILIKKFKFHIR